MVLGGGIGWAIAGASTIAREFMVDGIRNAGDKPLWVISRDAAHAGRFALECGIENHGTDLQIALSDPQVKAVYVGSANSRHHEQVLAAAAAGKHVLCDKPLATNTADAREMVSACSRAGVVLAVNHHLRASRLHQKMRQMIESGEIGEVRAISVLHAGLLRPALQTWRIEDESEGAIYLDLSVHDIDLARFLSRQEPVTVAGIGGCMHLGKRGIHDHAMYVMTLSGGAFLQGHESFVTPDVESKVLVLGSTGMLEARGSLSQAAAGALVHRASGAEMPIPIEPVDLYLDTISHFRSAIAGNGTPLASGEDGLISLAAAEAVREAVTTGSKMNVGEQSRATWGSGHRV